MTSNQLQYWRNEEEKRANRAREAENYRSNLAKETETHRSNVTNEQLKSVANALEEKNLAIRDKSLLNDLTNYWLSYGNTGFNALPESLKQGLNSAYGMNVSEPNAKEFDDVLSGIWEELKRVLGNRGTSTIISKLF